MNNVQDSSKRVKIFGKVVASALLIFGLYCFLGVWIPILIRRFKEGWEISDIMFLFIFPIPFSVFAGYCLVLACRLYKGLTKESLRKVCFISSLIVFVLLLSTVYNVLGLESSTPHRTVWFSLTTILCMIPAGLFYWLTNKYLKRWLGFDASIDWQRREKALRNFFGLMAFFVWYFFEFLVLSLEKAYDIVKKQGFNHVYLGNIPGHKYESTYCPKCNEMVIQRYGPRIVKFLLTKDLKCPKCGEKIPIAGSKWVPEQLWKK